MQAACKAFFAHRLGMLFDLLLSEANEAVK
jgi:hypothetical protein